MSQTGRMTQSDLQRTFIAMLFAFVVSVVAQQIAELLIVATSNWKAALSPVDLYQNVQAYLWGLTAVASHSLLALLMLSVSWVMWSRSQAAGHLVDIENIFSIKFITFLLEVFLVILYFALAKSSEGDFSAYAKDKAIGAYLTPQSARPEALQLLWIFIAFAVWDVIVDVIKSPINPAPVGAIKGIISFVTGVVTYCSVSLLCAGGALLISSVAPITGNPIQAVAGDIALIALLLLFNTGKVLEHYIFRIFPTEASRNNTKRTPTLRGNILVVFLISIFILSTLAIVVPCYPK
jgi:hypothetical protein